MSKAPALPATLPGGDMLPHMSARMRTHVIDALFEGSGGYERALAWIGKSDDNYGEFLTKMWARGAAKPVSHELTVSDGVEALWERLDAAERAQTIEGSFKQVEGS